jgi:hypothetical protein
MFSIVQIHKSNEKSNIILYDCPMCIFETIQSNDNKLVIDSDKNDIVMGKIYYKKFRFDEIRNIAKSMVKTPYVFSLDADEGIYDSVEEINSNLKGENAYSVQVASVMPQKNYVIQECTRIFKKEIDWFGWAHERPKVEQATRTDILIKHKGYSNEEINYQKAKRNIDLMLESALAISDKYQRYKLFTNLSLEFNKGKNNG